MESKPSLVGTQVLYEFAEDENEGLFSWKYSSANLKLNSKLQKCCRRIYHDRQIKTDGEC